MENKNKQGNFLKSFEVKLKKTFATAENGNFPFNAIEMQDEFKKSGSLRLFHEFPNRKFRRATINKRNLHWFNRTNFFKNKAA